MIELIIKFNIDTIGVIDGCSSTIEVSFGFSLFYLNIRLISPSNSLLNLVMS